MANKNKMKQISMIFLFLIILIFTGCSGQNSNSKTGNIQTGTQGIELNFINNAPPNEIYVDSAGGSNEFEATLELRNKGTYPKDGNPLIGKLFIGGFDKSVIDGTWDGGDSIPTELNGKSQSFPDGGYDLKTYRDNDVNFPFEAESYEPTIQVTACYQYETKSTSVVCVDPEPTSSNIKNKVCTIKDSSFSGGQGAPVGITSIEQTGNSKKTIFKINIANLGSGRIIEWSKYSDCMNLKFDEVDKVEVSAYISSLGRGDCTPEGTSTSPVRLQNSKGSIVCSFDNPQGTDAYTTPLEITLKYGYSNSISKKIKIIKME